MINKTKVGIFLFNEVEVLDFAGPFEVFSIAELEGQKLFEVSTISEKGGLISARNGLKIQSKYSFEDNVELDILIIPGGYGADQIEVNNQTVIEWVKMQKSKVKILASVCTGAFILAKAGLLERKKATTHWMDISILEELYLDIHVLRDTKFVDEGDIITSGGISAGINMSFHIIKRLFGAAVATATAKRMEYDIEIM